MSADFLGLKLPVIMDELNAAVLKGLLELRPSLGRYIEIGGCLEALYGFSRKSCTFREFCLGPAQETTRRSYLLNGNRIIPS